MGETNIQAGGTNLKRRDMQSKMMVSGFSLVSLAFELR